MANITKTPVLKPYLIGLILGSFAISLMAIYTDLWWLPFSIPVVIVALFCLLFKPIWYFYLLLASIPISTELELGSLGTDFPSEPIMWILLIFGVCYLAANLHQINSQYIRSPILWLILAHLIWLLIASLFSTVPLLSFKFIIAKLWYYAAFLFLPWLFLKSDRDWLRAIKFALTTLAISLMITLVRHGIEGFTFASINFVLAPFFRNHVTYASILVVLFPFLLYFFRFNEGWKKAGLLLLILLFLVGIYTSYTRAAYVCILLLLPIFLMVHYSWTKWFIPILLVGSIFFVLNFLNKEKYLEMAPDFNKTITHKGFNQLLEATYKMEDISTMERLYRWVAGIQMIRLKPLTGYGPNGFYPNYQSHTVRSFTTYVSDNPEKSGIHCYYLMVLVEQGWPGLILFILTLVLVLFTAQRVYINGSSATDQWLSLSFIWVIYTILLLILINDLLETDKIGSFFLLSISYFIQKDLRQKSNAPF